MTFVSLFFLYNLCLLTPLNQVGRVYQMCLVTMENAILYFDSFLESCIGNDTELSTVDFQMIGMVALLVSSKMFGVGINIKISELMQMAPQLKLKPNDLCVMELTLIQTLKFHLIVPTTVEFAHALLTKFEYDCSGKGLLIASIKECAIIYAGYLATEFVNLEFSQSEKAVIVASCAIARWSIMHEAIESAGDEAMMLEARLDAMHDASPIAETPFDPVVEMAHQVWMGTLAECAGTCGLLPISPSRRLKIQQSLFEGVKMGTKSAVYPTTPEPRSIASVANGDSLKDA